MTQRGEYDQQEGRQDDVEAALEGVAEQRHRAVVRDVGTGPTVPFLHFTVLPVRREQQRVDPAEAPLQGGDVTHVLAEVHDAAVQQLAFPAHVRGDESDHVVAAGSLRVQRHRDGTLTRPGHEGRHAAEVAGHGALFPPQRGEDVAGGDEQDGGEDNVDRNREEGKDFGGKLDESRQQGCREDNLLQGYEQDDHPQHFGVHPVRFHLPEAGNETAKQCPRQRQQQVTEDDDGEMGNRIRQGTHQQDRQKRRQHAQD